jgi:hypothetical protein
LIAIVIAVTGTGGAKASFITNSPDPFPPGSGFVQASGCLTGGPLSGLCADNVVGRILSSSSSFPGDGQGFVLDEAVTGDISDNGVPIGSFSVEGSLDVTLLGRSNPFQTGTFDGVVTFEDYLGVLVPVGAPVGVEFTLDPSQPSTAEVTIAELQGNRNLYRIDSFFDIFSQISIEGGAPIPVGGFPITVVGVPEPPTWTLLLLGFAGLGFAGYRGTRAGRAALAA